MLILTHQNISQLIQKRGMLSFCKLLIDAIEQDFKRWHEFQLTPRHASHYPQGVIELMPTSDSEFYSFKYVNGHPNNSKDNKLTVAATGMLSEVSSGYPLLFADMTLATALRTAATSALAAKYCALANSTSLGIIGTGAQSEFQVLAMHSLFNLNTIKFFDTDAPAMTKFENNLAPYNLNLIPCSSCEEVARGSDIITTATAAKLQSSLLQSHWIKPGCFINTIGGDCPGKTELDSHILSDKKIVVELLQQTVIEGESQQLDNSDQLIELWQIISGNTHIRHDDSEIIIFDSVGCAVEDYSILKLLYQQAQQQGVGETLEIIPQLVDSKDLFCLVKETTPA